MKSGTVVESPPLRNRIAVFRDRAHAGEVLAGLLAELRLERAIVLAIPAGGVPVAVVIADALSLPLDVAVVSKITLPWNSEVGYGAVAFDGTVRLNDELIARSALEPEEIERGIERATRKVTRRLTRLRGARPMPDVRGMTPVLVDDGLASGFTMRVAVEAVTKGGGSGLVVAVPTGHEASITTLASEVDTVCCANRRGGWGFAVADAYRAWSDVDEIEATRLLAACWGRGARG